jgi:hypothetical protein
MHEFQQKGHVFADKLNMRIREQENRAAERKP